MAATVRAPFFLTLVSNASTTMYPNNKPQWFKVELSTPLTFEGKWEVALCEYYYPNNMFNVSEETDFIITMQKASITRADRTITNSQSSASSSDSVSATRTSLVTTRSLEYPEDYLALEPDIRKEKFLPLDCVGNLDSPAAKEFARIWKETQEAKISKSTYAQTGGAPSQESLAQRSAARESTPSSTAVDSGAKVNVTETESPSEARERRRLAAAAQGSLESNVETNAEAISPKESQPMETNSAEATANDSVKTPTTSSEETPVTGDSRANVEVTVTEAVQVALIPVPPAISVELIAFEALEDYSDDGAKIVFRYQTPKGKFDSIMNLCTILNRRINKRLQALQWLKKVNPNEFLKQSPVTFEFDALENRVTFNSVYSGTTVEYKSTAYLPFALGFLPSKSSDITKVKTYDVGNDEPSLTQTYPAMFIYSNIIEYQMVGDSYAPLLRTVAIQTAAKEEIVSELFIRPFYHEINRNYIKTIEIRICNDAGDNIIFQKGKTVLVLHFRTRSLI